VARLARSGCLCWLPWSQQWPWQICRWTQSPNSSSWYNQGRLSLDTRSWTYGMSQRDTRRCMQQGSKARHTQKSATHITSAHIHITISNTINADNMKNADSNKTGVGLLARHATPNLLMREHRNYLARGLGDLHNKT
jgi:hypothetical protein